MEYLQTGLDQRSHGEQMTVKRDPFPKGFLGGLRYQGADSTSLHFDEHDAGVEVYRELLPPEEYSALVRDSYVGTT